MLECGNCDLQLEILYCQMVAEAMKVLSPFLSFARTFQNVKANYMMALMLYLKSKVLTCVHEFG